MSAVMTPGSPKSIDSLALLALKVAPNVFDLSSGLPNVSIRDQIVRGQLLMRDLYRAHEAYTSVLIVGAGIAGVSAAMAAAGMGKKVCLVDGYDEPFHLQRRAQSRFVGPFMYEWPTPFWDDQSYPPDPTEFWLQAAKFTPRWHADEPIKASELAYTLSEWLKAAALMPPPGVTPPDFWFRTDRNAVKAFVQAFAARSAAIMARRQGDPQGPLPPQISLQLPDCLDWLRNRQIRNPGAFTPDYVVLAAGMGPEITQVPAPPSNAPSVKGPPFWGEDNLRKPLSADQEIGIFGGGDGALQDVLRALTRFDHPLQMIKFLGKDPGVSKSLNAVAKELQTLESRYWAVGTWTAADSTFDKFERDCRQFAKKLAMKRAVRERVFKAIRKGTGRVRHFMREEHFTRSYLLNRFLVHLVDECRDKMGGDWVGRMQYECFPGSDVQESHELSLGSEYQYEITVKKKDASAETFEFHQISVRYGADKHNLPGLQMVQLSPDYNEKRTSLSHIPLPFVISD